MHSKVKPWDFFSGHKNFDSFFKSPTLIGFISVDPYIEKILKDKLKAQTQQFRLYSGNEITKNFLEEQFLNLTLFSEPESIKVINAEQIPNDVLNFFVNEIAPKLEVSVVLFFTKTNKGITEILKKSSSQFFELEEAKSWDGQKLLNLFLNEEKLKLNFEAQRFILDNIENTTDSFVELIGQLKMDFGDTEIDREALRTYIQKNRFDFFDLIDQYHRDRKKFLITLSRKSTDHEWFRQFSLSFQSYLAKVLNPEEIRNKDKLTKYDQGILAASENEPRTKLQTDLRLFSELEIMAKSKDEFLKDKIRYEILK